MVNSVSEETQQALEQGLRQLYGAYLYLRDSDLSETSNTSRLLHAGSDSHYFASRLADELQELAGVQSGEHLHSDRQSDTILEGSQVGYWLFLLAASANISFNDIAPHHALMNGYSAHYSDAKAIELREECLSLVATGERVKIVQGLELGFAVIGWACAEASISPLAPVEYDLKQMRRKGLVQ